MSDHTLGLFDEDPEPAPPAPATQEPEPEPEAVVAEAEPEAAPPTETIPEEVDPLAALWEEEETPPVPAPEPVVEAAPEPAPEPKKRGRKAKVVEPEPETVATAVEAAPEPEPVIETPEMPSVMDRPVALVTGASRGIGRGVALALARDGWFVVVNYAGNQTAADECLALVRAAGGDGITVQADISVREDRERLTDAALAVAGRIDLLVNNAGVAPQVRADLLDASEESFDRLLGINLKGPYFLTQRVARAMAVHHGERPPAIVTISSVSAYTASVNRGDYCLSKAGLSMLTALFATRLAEYGIGVYEVRPGVIDTDMTAGVHEKYDAMIEDGAWPIRRWGTPEDVGRAVASLARGDFPFSTGEVINVDGGFHLRTL